MELAMRVDPAWERAFFRYSHEAGRRGSNASYEVQGTGNLIDAFVNRAAFHSLNETAERLFQSTGKQAGVILLIVDNNYDYDVKFEYSDMGRWMINKLDGASGIPAGL